MHRIRGLKWWIGGAALLLVAWWAWRASNRSIDVDTAVIASGPLRVTISEAGTTRVHRHADVNATTTGRWVPRPLNVGDSVRAGQPLGALYAAPLDASAQEQARVRLQSAEASLREAESRIAAAKSAAADAQRTLERLEQVARAGGVSPQDLERLRTAAEERQSEYEASRIRAQVATYDVAAARSVVSSFGEQGRALAIVAPVSGRLLHVYEEHPRVVGAGTPLVEVGDPGDLEVVLPLLTSDAMRVQAGATVRMSTGGARDTLLGHVQRIEPAAFTKVSALGVDEQRVNVIVSIPPSHSTEVARIGDHYRVEAQVTVWEAPDVVRVPTAALVRDGDAWSVFVLNSGRAQRRAIRLGERSDDFAQVLSGLTPGDRVVLFPGDRVAPGVRVRERAPDDKR